MWFITENNFQSSQITIAFTWLIWFASTYSGVYILMEKDKFNPTIPMAGFVFISMVQFLPLLIFSIKCLQIPIKAFRTYKFSYSNLKTMTLPTKVSDIAFTVAKYFMTNNEDFECYQIQGEASKYTNKDLYDLNEHLIASGEKRGLKQDECKFFSKEDVTTSFASLYVLYFLFLLDVILLLFFLTMIIRQKYFKNEEVKINVNVIKDEEEPYVSSSEESEEEKDDNQQVNSFPSGYKVISGVKRSSPRRVSPSPRTGNARVITRGINRGLRHSSLNSRNRINHSSNDDLDLIDVKYSLSKVSINEKKETNEYFRTVYSDSIIVCPITTQPIKNKVITYCGHIFEKENLENWINPKIEKGLIISCPSCLQGLEKF